MKMKPVVEGAVIRDPFTKQPLEAEGSDVPESSFWVRRFQAGEVWKLDGKDWVRRTTKLNDKGERVEVLVREPYVAPSAAPTGAEPVTPLNTREVK